MYSSNDFMNFLHEDKVQRLRHDSRAGHGYHRGKLAGDMIESPFARVRSAMSTWVAGARNRDINQN